MNDLGANLLRYKIDKEKFILFDCETEGLHLHFSRPWSIGWLVCEGKNIVSRHSHYLWWPDLKVSAGAAAITHFNYNEYKEKAENPKLIYDQFHSYLFNDEYIRLGHNILKIDIQMVNSWRRGIGLPVDYSFINNRLIDTDCLQKAIKKDLKPQTPLINWMFKLSTLIEKGLKTNLGLCCKEYNISIDESRQHESLYDCELNWEVFKKQIYNIELESPIL